MLFSCNNNDMNEVSALMAGDSIPNLTANNFEFLRSVSGRIVARLQSPVMKQYDGENAHVVFPEGFKVEFYDELMQVESVITADYGINYVKKKLLNAKNNVVVINFAKDEKLYTDDLVWDQRLKTIYAKSDIKIIRPTEVLYGSGFESDENFKLYEVFKSKGEVEVEEEIK